MARKLLEEEDEDEENDDDEKDSGQSNANVDEDIAEGSCGNTECTSSTMTVSSDI